MPLFTLNHLSANSSPKIALKRPFSRTVIGYTLLIVSVVISIGTLAFEKERSQFKVFQVVSPIIQGSRITASNSKIVTISVSNKSLASQFLTTQNGSPAYARVPLSPGVIVEMGDLAAHRISSNGGIDMALALKSSQAPLAQLSTGDYIDLIATIGSGSSAISRVVAHAARVIEVSEPTSSFSQTNQNGSILVSLTNPIEPVAIAQAETAGQLVAIKISGPNSPSFENSFSASLPGSASTPHPKSIGTTQTVN